MEAIVRAATELGVARVPPALCERTIVRLEPARWRDRARRWQRVAREAAKQSGRAVVPEVEVPRPLAEWLGAGAPPTSRCASGKAAASRSARVLAGAGAPRSATVVVGPEGGLAVAEVEAARAAGLTDRLPRPAHPPDRDGGAGDRGDPPVALRRPRDERRPAGSTSRSRPTWASAAGARARGERRSRRPPWASSRSSRRPASVEAASGARCVPRPRRPRRCWWPGSTSASTCTRSRASWSHDVEMTVCTDTLAHGCLHGEPLDPARHRLGTVVKGATYHQTALTVQDGGP